MDRTRVTLTYDEIMDLRVLLNLEIKRLNEYIEDIGDPDGSQARQRARSAALYDKLYEATIRIT